MDRNNCGKRLAGAAAGGVPDELPRLIAALGFVKFNPGDGTGEQGILTPCRFEYRDHSGRPLRRAWARGIRVVHCVGYRNYHCCSVVLHPTTPSLIYAAVEPTARWRISLAIAREWRR